jgi:transposase
MAAPHAQQRRAQQADDHPERNADSRTFHQDRHRWRDVQVYDLERAQPGLDDENRKTECCATERTPHESGHTHARLGVRSLGHKPAVVSRRLDSQR